MVSMCMPPQMLQLRKDNSKPSHVVKKNEKRKQKMTEKKKGKQHRFKIKTIYMV